MQESTLQANLSLDTTIGEIVAADYRTSKVFETHGIDFCCGGKVALSAICQEKGVNPDTLLQEIAAIKTEKIDRSQNYTSWELPFLVDYIVNTHHAYLKENDEQIAAYARKIAEVHGAHHPEVVDIATIFQKIVTDMTAHLREEEEVFFPAVKRADTERKIGNSPSKEDSNVIKASLEKFGREHEEIGDAIHAIRHLSKDYALPKDTCNKFMITYQMLKEFEDDLHKHVHLENNILFPKASQL
ncbi:MAG: iron-sulfur cluster repair di-iron protein [Geobacteraceae bacterium]|nr:iron-sulfur cluster repair di-iron protein [Geobacteraceae bacterium]NTW79254.1 iron-sulfur cluster repair di-iron protein [Geobacteraceae bacterium]